MAMSKYTRMVFESMKERFGNRQFSIDEVTEISASTFYKYYKDMGIHCIHTVRREPWDLNRVVDFINGLAGEDCYGASWEFAVVDGQICEVYAEDYYYFDKED